MEIMAVREAGCMGARVADLPERQGPMGPRLGAAVVAVHTVAGAVEMESLAAVVAVVRMTAGAVDQAGSAVEAVVVRA
jgi:hypothetical protein